MPFYQHKAIDGDEWPRKRATSFERSPFETRFSETTKLLEREIGHLKPRVGSVIISTFHRPSEIRKDGMLRAETRMPDYPGVIVEFDSNDTKQKRYVKIQFVCDKFKDWKANVRAIALGMEALRKVERYGITSAQEQYEGFKAKALPPRVVLGESMNFADAQSFIVHKAGVPEGRINDGQQLDMFFRQAAIFCHPDKGGSHDDMAKLNIARDTLKAHYAR